MVIIRVFVSVRTRALRSAHRAEVAVLIRTIVWIALGRSAAESRTTGCLTTGLASVVSIRLGERLSHSTRAGCAIAVGIAARRLIRVTA